MAIDRKVSHRSGDCQMLSIWYMRMVWSKLVWISKAEVDEVDTVLLAWGANEHVVRLDVSMNITIGMY